nr:MAG TPA: hypothetical protein [Caudoviricetes sp.]
MARKTHNVISLCVWFYIYEATTKQINRGWKADFVISMKQKCYIYGHLSDIYRTIDYKANRDN